MSALDNLITNYDKVVFTNMFQSDKIVDILSGSYPASSGVLTGGYLYLKTFPHPFGRPLFCDLRWSTDGTNYSDGGSGTSISGQGAIAFSDSSNVYILSTTNSGTIYYQITLTWIKDYDTTNPSITPYIEGTEKTVFDSRKNYQKIYDQDVRTGTGTSGTISITHPLARTPNFKVYFESFTGQVWPCIFGGARDIWLYDFSTQYEMSAIMSTTALTLTYAGGVSSTSLRAWYRIYLDD